MSSAIITAAVVLGTVLVISVCGQTDPARYSPLTWCDDADLAKHVGVAEKCDAYSKAVRNQKVNVTLLYESFCGGCRDVITHVYPIIYPKFKDYANFEFVPYGNTESHWWGFECDHGKAECQFDQVETCAIHFVQNVDTRFKFLLCIENMPEDVTPENALEFCYENASISNADRSSISGCWNSNLGSELETAMGKRTDSIWPVKHQWVPWIMINNASTNQAQYLLAVSDDQIASLIGQQICDVYRGDSIPAPCQTGLQ